MNVCQRGKGHGRDSTGYRSMFQREADKPLDFINREGFLDDSSRPKQFGDIQEILIAGSARHGNNFGVKEFLRQRERDLHAITLRHENICDHKIGGIVPVQIESHLSIRGFTDRMAVVF